MKLKFLLLMICLVLTITAFLMTPMLLLSNFELVNQSKKSTETVISALSITYAVKFLDYITGTKRDKITFKNDLQDSVMDLKRKWQDASELFVIDEYETIIASSDHKLIGKKYTDYKDIPEFQKKLSEIILPYLKDVSTNNSELNKVEDKIQRVNIDIINLRKYLEEHSSNSTLDDTKFFLLKKYDEIFYNIYNKKKTRLEDEIADKTEYEKSALNIKKKISEVEKRVQQIEKNPLYSLENPVKVNRTDEYTLIYPIILDFGEKSKTVGIFFATISTDFIRERIVLAIIFACIIAVLVILLSLFLIKFYAKIIVNPIILLTNGVKQVASGNLDMKIPVKGKDEIAVLGNEFNNMIRIWREKLLMEKYVSKSTVSMIEDVQTGLNKDKPQRKKITIFFSDIRGFTTYSEKFDPLSVITSLNAIFNIQVQIIKKYGGDIDKFVGDEIMAEFSHPSSALKSALEIQKAMANFNKTRKYKLKIGIGINFGDAVVGSVGAEDSLDWTAIGDTVNLGARLCEAAPPDKILISQNAYKKIKTALKPVKKKLKVKGKEDDILVYEL